MAIDRTEATVTLLSAASRIVRMAASETGTTVSASAWAALGTLVSDGPQRTGELARVVRISQPGMTKLLQGLAADGWVSRVAADDDSRSSLIDITDTGRAALRDWRRQLAAAAGSIFDDLDDVEWTTISRAGDILTAHLTRKEVVA